jgi:hypothetical protein
MKPMLAGIFSQVNNYMEIIPINLIWAYENIFKFAIEIRTKRRNHSRMLGKNGFIGIKSFLKKKQLQFY